MTSFSKKGKATAVVVVFVRDFRRSTLRKTGQLAQHDATRHECDAGVVRSRRLALVGKVSCRARRCRRVGCAVCCCWGRGQRQADRERVREPTR